VTLFRDGNLKQCTNVHDSVDLTSCEDLYTVMIEQFQPLDPIKKALGLLTTLTKTHSVVVYTSLSRRITLRIP
jgi:hypothetical protein